MKKYILILSSAILLLTACEKSNDSIALPDPSIQLAQEAKIINKFIADNNLKVTKLAPTGIYYNITDSGNTILKPTSSSIVTVKYTGHLLNGNTFTHQDSVKFALKNALPGLQLGLPLIGKGGKIRLILPSGYAYDRQGSNNKLVAPNEVVNFDIELLDVK